MADDWVTCELCGARMKADKLEDHKKRVHPGGATTREERQRQASRQEGMRRMLRVGFVVALAVVLVVGGYAVLQLGHTNKPQLDQTGEPVVGSANAPLTVFLVEDYRCPYCQAFELNQGWSHLNQTWVQTGKVRVVFINYAFLGPGSITAAEASHCVNAQNPTDWHAWHHLVFKNQGSEQTRWATVPFFENLTARWGHVDSTQFDQCLENHTYQSKVQSDHQELQKFGISGTPSIVIQGQIIDPRDTRSVDDAINNALQGA